MAITKAALIKAGGFDPMFTTAGDDVDLSWRLTAANETLAYAPGAVVIHERRATLAAYLRQQRGYGTGEGLLYRKYPLRSADQDGMYAGASSIGALLGGARVYYGEFGRGLFQTVYSASNSYVDLPLTIEWIGISLTLIVFGYFKPLFGVLGAGGIAITILVAAARAASASLRPEYSGPVARIYLGILNLLGPSVRSLARIRVKERFDPTTSDADSGPVGLRGQLEFVIPDGSERIQSATILAAMRDALVRSGLAVAETDGFQSYDLEIVVPPTIRVPINAVRADSRIALRWRTRIAPRRALIGEAILLLVILASGFAFHATIWIAASFAIAHLFLALSRAVRIPAVIKACAREVASSLGVSIAEQAKDEAR
jgi:hypothetical protein